MSADPMRMCELLVGLPEVGVLEVTEVDDMVRVKIETCGIDRCVSGVAVR